MISEERKAEIRRECDVESVSMTFDKDENTIWHLTAVRLYISDAMFRERIKTEELVEAAKELYRVAKDTVDAPMSDVDGHLTLLDREVDHFDTTLSNYRNTK